MSLLSTFHAGDPVLFEAAARGDTAGFARQTRARGFDFSGGLTQPFLMPEDFHALTSGGADGFWTLKDGNLLKGEEHGLHRLPEREIDRILSLTPGELRRFSEAWNRRRQGTRARATRARSIWRSRPYRAITGGVSFGLLLTYTGSPGSATPLALLAVWLVLAIAAGVGMERKRRAARQARPDPGPVDWVEPLTRLQSFLREARTQSQAVVYSWSL